MLILLTSPDALYINNQLSLELCEILIEIQDSGTPVGIVSNHDEPRWFNQYLSSNSRVQFLRYRGRQKGVIVSKIAKKFGLFPHNVLVLSANMADIQMAKNGGAVIMGASWSDNEMVKSLGLLVSTPNELLEIIKIIRSWPGRWWAECSGSLYSVKALSDLSGYNQSKSQVKFADKVKKIVKRGSPNLNALLAIASRSLLEEGFGGKSNLFWGVYPSSKSKNNDTEILSDFVSRLRTTVSRVQFAKKGFPLFIRHTPSIKRSANTGVDRTNPDSQLTTINLNPYYKGKLRNKNIILVDDCTTHGVSFGVASAFLRKAGVRSITCIALGKFGDVLNYYDISIKSDPFEKLTPGDFSVRKRFRSQCSTDDNIRDILHTLFP